MTNLTADSFLPWFVNVIIAIAVLMALFIVGVDLPTFAASW